MDELKKYIRQHADQLDLDEPRLQVWEQIKQQSAGAPPKTTVVTMVTRWAVAACVLLLAGIGGWWLLQEKHTATELASRQKPITEKATTISNEPVTKTDNTEAPVMVQTRVPVTKQTVVAAPSRKHTQPTADMIALQHMESSFTQVINLQRERVSSIPMYAESPAYFNDFAIQIRQMEKDEKQIKSDIARRGMTDGLLDQLINLYQQKLTILKQLQTEMTKTNNRYKQNRVPVDSAKTYFLKI